MVVGRAPDLCDVALVDEPTVSARQCRLYTECGKVYLMDLDGTNPTYHNNLKVIEDVALRNGDVISFGEVDLYLSLIHICLTVLVFPLESRMAFRIFLNSHREIWKLCRSTVMISDI